jgi:hypothetical protein
MYNLLFILYDVINIWYLFRENPTLLSVYEQKKFRTIAPCDNSQLLLNSKVNQPHDETR